MQKQTDVVLEPLVKQEQLDAEWGGSCANVYDALFDVVKHEVDDDTAVAGYLRDDDAASGGSVPRATTERQSTRDMVSRYQHRRLHPPLLRSQRDYIKACCLSSTESFGSLISFNVR